MMKIISIGLIPINSDTEIIYCGDSETSNTIELNFKIENQKILGLDNNFSFSFIDDFLTTNSNHLKELSKYISSFGIKISPHSSLRIVFISVLTCFLLLIISPITISLERY